MTENVICFLGNVIRVTLLSKQVVVSFYKVGEIVLIAKQKRNNISTCFRPPCYRKTSEFYLHCSYFYTSNIKKKKVLSIILK